ncbi:hypothetical protein U1Q18_025025, partial [Sarracenia purpurea var. burkii]
VLELCKNGGQVHFVLLLLLDSLKLGSLLHPNSLSILGAVGLGSLHQLQEAEVERLILLIELGEVEADLYCHLNTKRIIKKRSAWERR